MSRLAPFTEAELCALQSALAVARPDMPDALEDDGAWDALEQEIHFEIAARATRTRAAAPDPMAFVDELRTLVLSLTDEQRASLVMPASRAGYLRNDDDDGFQARFMLVHAAFLVCQIHEWRRYGSENRRSQPWKYYDNLAGVFAGILSGVATNIAMHLGFELEAACLQFLKRTEVYTRQIFSGQAEIIDSTGQFVSVEAAS